MIVGSHTMSSGDLALIRRVIAGEPAAYGLLRREVHRAFEQAWARLSHRFPGMEVERRDLLQGLEEHLVGQQYHVLRTFRGDARLGTWLHAVAARHIGRGLQSATRRRAHVGVELDLERADPGSDPEAQAAWAAEVTEVHRVLSSLSDEERTLIALFYEQGLDASQVASALGLKPGGVRMRKQRLLARLHDALRRISR